LLLTRSHSFVPWDKRRKETSWKHLVIKAASAVNLTGTFGLVIGETKASYFVKSENGKKKGRKQNENERRPNKQMNKTKSSERASERTNIISTLSSGAFLSYLSNPY
jgi:Na+/glutamate symporter